MSCFRVKYRIEYNQGTDKYRLPKAPELIKIADSVASDVFFDSSSDYASKWVTLSDLNSDYGQQIFFDVTNEKNMIFTNTQISGNCLNSVYKFTNAWILADGIWDDSGIWVDDDKWND
jgi:hypothetical protein